MEPKDFSVAGAQVGQIHKTQEGTQTGKTTHNKLPETGLEESVKLEKKELKTKKGSFPTFSLLKF